MRLSSLLVLPFFPQALHLSYLVLIIMSSSTSASSQCGLPDVEETGGLTLTYMGKKVTYDHRVDLNAAKDPPVMKADLPEGGELLLLMIDPDAPNPESCPDKYWLHWIAKVAVQKGGALNVKQSFVDYYPPSPPQTSSLHRYQVVAYPLTSAVPSNAVPKGRSGFNLASFLSHLGLRGDYVAATQFKAGHKTK